MAGVVVDSLTWCYRAAEAIVLTTLRITGMTCNGCVRHVDKALRDVPGVTAVEVNLADQRAKIVHDESAPIAGLVAAVESAGYSAAT